MIYLYSTRCNHSKILYFESTHPNSWLSRSFFLAFFFSPTPSIFNASAPLDPIFAFDAARVHKLSSSQTSQTFFFSPTPSMFKASWSHLCFWCSSSQTFCHTNCFGHYCHYWHLTELLWAHLRLQFLIHRRPSTPSLLMLLEFTGFLSLLASQGNAFIGLIITILIFCSSFDPSQQNGRHQMDKGLGVEIGSMIGCGINCLSTIVFKFPSLDHGIPNVIRKTSTTAVRSVFLQVMNWSRHVLSLEYDGIEPPLQTADFH